MKTGDGADFAQRRPLVAIEFRARIGLARSRRLRILRPDVEFRCQRLAGERPETAPPCRHLLGESLHVDSVAAGIEQCFEQFGLPGRFLCQGLDIERARRIGRRDVSQYRVQRSALAQQGRNRCRGHFTDGVMVIVAGEADEPEIFLAQQRGVIEALEYAADPAARQVAAARMGDDQPNLALLAEGHTHARARRRAASAGRRQIVEQSRQRHVDGDFEDRRVAHEFPVKTVSKVSFRRPSRDQGGRE